MAVAPNGDYLYVTDTANRALVKVALPSLTRSAVFAVPSLVDTSVRVLSVRPSGSEIVLLSNGIALSASNGRVLSTTLPSHGMMAAPPSGKALYSIDAGYSPASLGGARIDYSEMGGGTLFVLNQIGAAFSSAGSNGADVAVGRDGQRVYTASGAPYQCASFQASDLSAIGYLPGGEAYPNNVEVGSDGRIYCGINGIYSKSDVWVYAADGTLQGSFKFVGYAKGLLPRQMVVSADGLVLVALTDDPLMAIVPVGP
jgi:DNA-binding beta-propeller fold protein YncE